MFRGRQKQGNTQLKCMPLKLKKHFWGFPKFKPTLSHIPITRQKVFATDLTEYRFTIACLRFAIVNPIAFRLPFVSLRGGSVAEWFGPWPAHPAYQLVVPGSIPQQRLCIANWSAYCQLRFSTCSVHLLLPVQKVLISSWLPVINVRLHQVILAA